MRIGSYSLSEYPFTHRSAASVAVDLGPIALTACWRGHRPARSARGVGVLRAAQGLLEALRRAIHGPWRRHPISFWGEAGCAVRSDPQS
jgi:hypothetical protein